MRSNIKDKVVVYQDNNEDWRWTFISGYNGRKLADSGQGYTRRIDCKRAMHRVTNNPKIRMEIFRV